MAEYLVTIYGREKGAIGADYYSQIVVDVDTIDDVPKEVRSKYEVACIWAIEKERGELWPKLK